MITPHVFQELTGTVVEFNESSGLGRVASNSDEFRFHCIEIADGSRTIEVGAQVAFLVEPKLGGYEATRLSPVASS